MAEKLQFLAKYGTLITFYRLLGIPYFGYPLRYPFLNKESKWPLLSLIPVLFMWLSCLSMLVNGIACPLLYEPDDPVFNLVIDRSTPLARTIAKSQITIVTVLYFAEIAFNTFYLGHKVVLIERQMRDTLSLLPNHLADAVTKQVARSLAAFYAAVVTHSAVGMTVCFFLQGLTFSLQDFAIPLQNFQFFAFDFSLHGHIFYVATFYGTLFKQLPAEVVRLAFSCSHSLTNQELIRIVRLFGMMHERIDQSRDALRLQISFKVPVVILITIQNVYLVLLHFILGGNSNSGSMNNQSIFFLCNVLHYMIWIFTLCLASQRLTDSKAAFYQLINQQAYRPEVQRQADRFSPLKDTCIAYHGCGFFTLNKSLLVTILGIAITYSVILIQSDTGHEST